MVLEYKGYRTKIEFDREDNIFYGKIEGIRDFVNFHTDDCLKIEEKFHDAVDDYLEFCREIEKDPEVINWYT